MTSAAVPKFNESLTSTDHQAARVHISGTGSALPSIVVTNNDLARHLDTTDTWIFDRVGIRKRYVCSPEESAVSLAEIAATRAFEAAGIGPEDVDVILFATITPDQGLPSAAALLAQRLGVRSSVAFDLQAACSGFLFGLVTAEALLTSLNLKTALIVGAEALSRIVDWKDRNTAVLFGDGAGACVLSRPDHPEESCIVASHLDTHAEDADLIGRAAVLPSLCAPATLAESKIEEPYIKMNGRAVFRGGVQLMTDSIERVLEASSLSIDDISLFFPHQSNVRMINAVCENVGLFDRSKIATNISEVGNTSAASVPIVMDEYCRAGRIQQNDLTLLTAVGSGMTYGSVLVRW